MSSIRSPRFLTSVGIFVLAGFCILRGVELVHFSLVEQGLTARDAETSLKPYIDRPGLSVLARRGQLTAVGDTPTQIRIDKLVALLSVAPVSSTTWAALAQTRIAMGRGDDKALAALAISHLTGPNEVDSMARRGVIALMMWDSLPPELRRPAIADLIGSWQMKITPSERQFLGSLLADYLPKAREEIRAALLLAGPNGEAIAKALSLEEKAD